MPAATSAVAATEVHGQRDIAAIEAAQARVVSVNVIPQRLIRVNTQSPPLLPPIVRQVVRVVGVIDLHIGDALGDERNHLVFDDHRRIMEYGCSRVVHLVGHARLVAARHHVRCCRHGHFVRAVGMLLNEGGFATRQAFDLLELLAEDPAPAATRSARGVGGVPSACRRCLNATLKGHGHGRCADYIAFNGFTEVAGPTITAILAICVDIDA